MDNIAIIGMGCLFPDYSDKEKFWNTLMSGGNFLYSDEFMGKPIERSGLPYTGTNFFSGKLSDAEIEEFKSLGDLYKWVAYVTDEALKDAGYAKNDARLRRTGMIVGSVAQTVRDQFDFMYPLVNATVEKEINSILGSDHFRHDFKRQNENLRVDSILPDTEPVRYIAQKRGLGGPVVMFNAACATPLYAMWLASRYLNSGEADMIIAGAHCSNETTAGICGLFDTFGVLCEEGESRPLDKNSKGLITGSGAGVFALKRLADAQRDGDRILAVIESVGLSNDGGSGGGIVSPSVSGQLDAYEAAYAGGLSRHLDYIECHATGTVAGDRTEIEAIDRFFGDGAEHPRPMLGALKGSTGHFFTATGCASIAKVIMAMEHGVIPATIAVQDPICEGIVLENTPWISDGKLKRAGVNAFGFGGINAHLVMSEYDSQSSVTDSPPPDHSLYETDLAIVGMGLHIGNFRCVEDFLQGLATAGTSFAEPDDGRWRGFHLDKAYMEALGLSELPKGSYINSIEFDTMRFKMPVMDNPYFLRRDMLMLETAAEALDDAGIKKGESPRTAVLVHSAPDYTDQLFMASVELNDSLLKSLSETCPELTDAQREEVVRILRDDECARESADTVPGMITNIRGCRISAHWGFTGPSFTVFERETSIFRCLDLARFFLSEGIVDQVVIGLSSLSGELENIYAQKEFGVMGQIAELGFAEGAVALVVKRVETALECGNRIYASISGIAAAGASNDTYAGVEDAFGKALSEARVGEGEIRAMEAPKSYDPAYRDLIESVCRERYGAYLDPEAFEVLEVESCLGFGFSLSAAASIVRHALQLYLSRVFSRSSSLNSRNEWDLRGAKRASLVTGYSREGLFGCAVMTECGSHKPIDRKLGSRFISLPFRFGSRQELAGSLRDIATASEKGGLRQLYSQFWADYRNANDPDGMKHTAVLLCYSKETLRDEAEQMLQFASSLSEDEFIYESARGSYCAAVPHGLKQDSVRLEEFAPQVYTDEIAADFSACFGIPQEVARHLRLGDITMLYRPVNYLLRLSAKLLSHEADFDHDIFYTNFDFHILNQPSFIREIPTGMPGFLEGLASPENRNRVAAKAAPVSQAVKPIWDYDQILEMTSGSMAKVLGEQYSALDAYEIRTRIPMPPFMFVGRITGLDARFGKLEPSSIEMEYDIGEDCILMMSKSSISYVLLTESSHVSILLLAYIGVDLIYSGTLRYRILDTKVRFHSDFPVKGDTIRAKLQFRDFINNGKTMLVRATYACYCGDRLILSIDMTGGFFTDKDLDANKGLVRPGKPQKELMCPAAVPKIRAGGKEKPAVDLAEFYDGKYGPSLYPSRNGSIPERMYISPKIRMADRIVSLDHYSGMYGLGKVVCEMDLDENHWAFAVHFKNDPVFPGSLLAEAANQLQVLYAVSAGYLGDSSYYLESMHELPVTASFRGQVRPVPSVVRYELHVKSIRERGSQIALVSDCDVFWQGVCVCRTENTSLVITEDKGEFAV